MFWLYVDFLLIHFIQEILLFAFALKYIEMNEWALVITIKQVFVFIYKYIFS